MRRLSIDNKASEGIKSQQARTTSRGLVSETENRVSSNRIKYKLYHTNYSLDSIDYNLYGIISTLTAIIFLHYWVATKMALEILGYTTCRVHYELIVYHS